MLTKTVRFHETGGPEVLRIESLETGEPAAGEMRINIKAIGLNRAEAAYRSGRYLEQARLPSRLGYEAAGTVAALGEGVSGFAVGDAVCVIPAFSMNQYGVYAESAIVPAYAVLKQPDGLKAEQAASIWMQYLTAYGALIDIVKIRNGEAVVITAASSSVGLAAIQIANSAGAVPIAVTRTADKKSRLIEEGAAHVIVSDSQDIPAEVMRITDKKGARLVFDPIAGPVVTTLADSLAPGGILMMYGNLSGKARETIIPFGPMIAKGLSLRGYLVFEIIRDAARLERAKDFTLAGLQDGTLKPVIDRIFTLDRIVEAHRYLEDSRQIGKIVVTVSST